MNHNINPIGFAELEAIAETPSAAVTIESEAPKEAPAAEKIEAEVTAVENGNNGTPKTNGNNSHSNGSAATPENPVWPLSPKRSAQMARLLLLLKKIMKKLKPKSLNRTESNRVRRRAQI